MTKTGRQLISVTSLQYDGSDIVWSIPTDKRTNQYISPLVQEDVNFDCLSDGQRATSELFLFRYEQRENVFGENTFFRYETGYILKGVSF